MHRQLGLELDETVERRIEEYAEATGLSKEEIVKKAVESFFATVGQGTWLERAERIGLIGCVEGGPTDLSTNKAHFEGFGRE